MPSGPVSWYGVASPAAVSGCAGTMMSQDTLAAAAAATAGAVDAVAVADDVADGQMTGVAVGVAVAVAGVVSVDVLDVLDGVGVGVAVPVPVVPVPVPVVPVPVVPDAAKSDAVVVGAAVVGAAVLDAAVAAASAGVAQPAAFAVLLAVPNMVPKWGAISRATPTPTTAATTPTIATSLRRDRCPEPQLSR